MKNKIIWGLIAVLSITGLCGVYFYPKGLRLEASGKLQNGSDYRVECDFRPTLGVSLLNPTYRIVSLALSKAGTARSVPTAALTELQGFDPKRALLVSEEGPVVVITTWIKDADGVFPVQWRFLNGQFAQRRILKKGEVMVKNEVLHPQAPTLVQNINPEAPRRLQSPSILSAPADITVKKAPAATP
jgi:hypothetical protein